MELERLAAAETARADLGSAEILKDGDVPAGARGRFPYRVVGPPVRLVRPVREVEPEHVDAAGDERVEDLGRAAGRTERGDDLGVPRHCHGSTSAFGIRMASASASASFS